jgi:PAS domain S-box-containing protein
MTFISNTDAEILMIYNEFNHLIEHLEKREKQRDIASNELRIQELRYRQMADMLPVGIFEAGADMIFTYFNKRFEETFGYTYEEGKKLKLCDIVSDTNILEELSLTTSLKSIETTGTGKNGIIIPVLIYCSERLEDNKLIGFRGIIVDITDRVDIIKDLHEAKIKAEESDRLKTAFLANMSHEIRTPMNAIIGFSELLNAELPADSNLIEYINQIQNSGRLLIKIIDDIIDIAKIESGELNIVIEKCEINNLLDDLHQHYQGIIKINNHPIIISLLKDSSVPVYVHSDPFRIRQIFNNLLNNAIKFTSEGSIEFGYRLEKEAIRFFVKDSGIGIPSIKHDIVFERFRQVDESMSRKFGGTGLGLSIVKNLAELLGGSINLVSEEGLGSEFTFTIPVKGIETGSVINTTSDELASQKFTFTWGVRTLLIAEDNYASLQLLIHILKPTGIKIISASNGIEAVEKYINNNYIDIILMDIQMPFENGFEATKKIRKINSEVPIIAQTAYAMAAEQEMCKKAGCTDYLTKPIKKNELLNKIDKYLKLT